MCVYTINRNMYLLYSIHWLYYGLSLGWQNVAKMSQKLTTDQMRIIPVLTTQGSVPFPASNAFHQSNSIWNRSSTVPGGGVDISPSICRSLLAGLHGWWCLHSGISSAGCCTTFHVVQSSAVKSSAEQSSVVWWSALCRAEQLNAKNCSSVPVCAEQISAEQSSMLRWCTVQRCTNKFCLLKGVSY